MVTTFFNDFVDDSAGATAVEYGLIVSLIVIAMIVSLQTVAGETISMWGRVETEIVNATGN